MKFISHLFLSTALGLSFIPGSKAAQPGVDVTMPTDSPSPADSQPTSQDDTEINDPLEPLNRLFFGLNRVLDTVVLKPLAVIYETVLPTPVQNGIGNIIQNLASPIYFVNHILQGNAELAAVTMLRAVVNTTVGLGGLIDVGADIGLKGVPTGFSDTLGVWGVDTGPYLMLPVFGPHTFRGTGGIAGDCYANPFFYYFNQKHHHKYRWMQYGLTGLETVHNRSKVIESLDDLEKGSADYYAAVRSIHFQQQKHKVSLLKSLKKKSYEDSGSQYNTSPREPTKEAVTESPKP